MTAYLRFNVRGKAGVSIVGLYFTPGVYMPLVSLILFSKFPLAFCQVISI